MRTLSEIVVGERDITTSTSSFSRTGSSHGGVKATNVVYTSKCFVNFHETLIAWATRHVAEMIGFA